MHEQAACWMLCVSDVVSEIWQRGGAWNSSTHCWMDYSGDRFSRWSPVGEYIVQIIYIVKLTHRKVHTSRIGTVTLPPLINSIRTADGVKLVHLFISFYTHLQVFRYWKITRHRKLRKVSHHTHACKFHVIIMILGLQIIDDRLKAIIIIITDLRLLGRIRTNPNLQCMRDASLFTILAATTWNLWLIGCGYICST